MPRRSIPPVPSAPADLVRLPEKPNLEFERKRAKKLLRALREARPDALERARRQRVRRSAVQLADAQLILAREYGFASWPRLVEYFSTWERHDRAERWPESHPLRAYDTFVSMLTRRHASGRPDALHRLAALVPRFYARTDAEIAAATLSEDEARLAVAREHGFPSWAALLTRTAEFPEDEAAYSRTPLMQGVKAVRARDRAAVEALLQAHSELLDELVLSALHSEHRTRAPEAREMTDWLASRGANVTRTLNRMLLGGPHRDAGFIAFVLERGGDPAWVPPGEMSVLEHALLRYWNREAVELIASRVVPRQAFWIAAGLGDVPAMLGYLDRKGRPTERARRDRPDMVVAGLGPPPRPDADDLEILWEAFFVAGVNQRLDAIDALLDRGFPIDYDRWGNTLLEFAVGNAFTPLAEHLLKRGAKSKSDAG